MADPLRGQFVTDLATLGDYPVRRVRSRSPTVVAHSRTRATRPGAQLIQWEYDSFLVDIRGNVWAVNDGPSTRIFEGAINPILVPPTTQDVFVSGTYPLDSAPGGSRASLAQADSTEAPYGDIVALYPSHCFIPTISALDLSSADVFFDVASEPDPAALSPFDAVYFPAANEEHVLVTAQNAQWIKQEIFQTPTDAPPTSASTRLAVLYPTRPNPFNPETTIAFWLAADAHVRLQIFDVRGARVRVLLDEARPAGDGRVKWNGRDDMGRMVSSGVYYGRLVAGDESRVQGMVLVK